MKTGIFGGAFNPVHSGHVNLAKSYIDILSLDRLLVIPTAVPPHREGRDFAPAQDRFNMLSLAFEGTQKVEISDIEFRLSDKSYTYNTLIALKEQYPDDEFYLIVGEDQFLSFDKWFRYRDILDMAVLCTAPREENARQAMIEFAESTLNLSTYYLAGFKPYVVSSSEIRAKIKSGKSIAGLVPQAVEEYIISKGLYSD